MTRRDRIRERHIAARFYATPEVERLGYLMIGHAKVCHLCPGCRRAREAAAAITRGDDWP